jgi:hypothetical protein
LPKKKINIAIKIFKAVFNGFALVYKNFYIS